MSQHLVDHRTIDDRRDDLLFPTAAVSTHSGWRSMAPVPSSMKNKAKTCSWLAGSWRQLRA